MKIIGIDNEEEKIKKVNKKKILITGIVALIVVLVVLITALYIGNASFRKFFDQYILMKTVTENHLPSITIEEADSNSVYAYDKYIALLKNNVLTGYNASGKQEYTLDVQITTPMIDSNNRFFLIGEKNAQKLYLISGSKKVWEKEVEGNLTRVCVNKNGYVAVVLGGTTYKSVIQIFDANGKELFKTYLSNSTVVDVSISYDNRFVSFVEISTNGTQIQSTIKTVSVEKATTNPSEAIVYTSEMQNNRLPLSIQYQEKNKLVCMFDTEICILQDNQLETVMSLEEADKKITFGDIGLTGSMVRLIEKSNLLSTQTTLEMMNVDSKRTSSYILEDAVKEMNCYEEVIALNLGAEVHFIGTNGWLKKSYTSSQEIKRIVLTNSFAGIVYRDKIEIVQY